LKKSAIRLTTSRCNFSYWAGRHVENLGFMYLTDNHRNYTLKFSDIK